MEGRAKGGRIREAWTGVFQKQSQTENSLAVQWLGLCAFTAQGTGSIPGWGTETAWPKKKKKETSDRDSHFASILATAFSSFASCHPVISSLPF